MGKYQLRIVQSGKKTFRKVSKNEIEGEKPYLLPRVNNQREGTKGPFGLSGRRKNGQLQTSRTVWHVGWGRLGNKKKLRHLGARCDL